MQGQGGEGDRGVLPDPSSPSRGRTQLGSSPGGKSGAQGATPWASLPVLEVGSGFSQRAVGRNQGQSEAPGAEVKGLAGERASSTASLGQKVEHRLSPAQPQSHGPGSSCPVGPALLSCAVLSSWPGCWGREKSRAVQSRSESFTSHVTLYKFLGVSEPWSFHP